MYLTPYIMNYSTVEAYVEKTRIVFPENFHSPKKRMRVLVTFMEENEDYTLYELPVEAVTEELSSLSKKVLWKNTSLLTNI